MNEKYDITYLRSTLCCLSKQLPIYDVLKTLTIDEAIVLRNELRGAYNRKLNQFLELAFKNKIGD